VELVRTYKFRNSGQTYNGIPIMAANMDTVGTFEMAKSLYSVSDYCNEVGLLMNCFIAQGIHVYPQALLG